MSFSPCRACLDIRETDLCIPCTTPLVPLAKTAATRRKLFRNRKQQRRNNKKRKRETSQTKPRKKRKTVLCWCGETARFGFVLKKSGLHLKTHCKLHKIDGMVYNLKWTLQRLRARVLHERLDKKLNFSRVTEEHVQNKNSNIPLSCLAPGCGHEWSPTINNVINGGYGCPECSGNVPWTLVRLRARAKRDALDKKFNFSRVTEEHVQNASSNIPLSCLPPGCGHEWSPTIHSVINGGRGCPKCVNKTEGIMVEFLQNQFQKVRDTQVRIPLSNGSYGKWDGTVLDFPVKNNNAECDGHHPYGSHFPWEYVRPRSVETRGSA